MRSVAKRTFVSGRIVPLPQMMKPSYKVTGGKTETQVRDHIVRDASTALRKGWKVEAEALRRAYVQEQKEKPSRAAERAERQRLKQELAQARQGYYRVVQEQEAAARRAKSELAARFWARREAVLAEARREMVKALVEDASMWEQHPREMLNRRYKTLNRKHFLTAFN